MDIRQQYFGISAFAKLCGLSRKTLIFYDRIGLFSPARVDANGYRRYSFSQLDMITAIQAFKELDMPLDTIRSHLLERTPENTLQLFAAQKSVIQQKI